MIKVLVKEKNSIIESVRITGHAGFDISGKDIVCAATSSITITTINAILKLDHNAVDYDSKNGLNITVKKHNEYVDVLINNMLDLLTELEMQYKKNIKINREVS